MRILKDYFFKLSQLISRRSILPASMFSKKQLSKIHQDFERFWNSSLPYHKQVSPKTFSTFTLGTPITLWSYYFPCEPSRKKLLNSYSRVPLKIRTFDGLNLQGHLFKKKKSGSNPSRALIVFGGNGELYKIGSAAWLFSLLEKTSYDFDIIMFDPRECGESEGIASAASLIRDGISIFDFVRNQLKIDIDSIDLCGFSLGGAIATHVKAFYPESKGVLISNRSFQSLEKAIRGFFKPLGPFFSQWFGKWAIQLAEQTSWTLSPLHVWSTIKSPKIVICHSKDPIIHHSASLEKGLHDDNLLEDCLHIHLIQKNPIKKIKNHHVEPLSSYNDQSGEDAQSLILHFLSDRDFQKKVKKS